MNMHWREQWHKMRASRALTVGLATLGVVLVTLLIFDAGVSYGERRALTRAHGFGGPVVAHILPHGFIPDGHGAVGTVAAVTLPTFTIQTRDGEQETILIGSSTVISSPSPSPQPSDIHPGSGVLVIGDPSEQNETIDARFIRILPAGH